MRSLFCRTSEAEQTEERAALRVAGRGFLTPLPRGYA